MLQAYGRVRPAILAKEGFVPEHKFLTFGRECKVLWTFSKNTTQLDHSADKGNSIHVHERTGSLDRRLIIMQK